MFTSSAIAERAKISGGQKYGSPLLDEDSIDLETLQAQIDLSMSYAQMLVSSWVQPAKHPNGRQQDLEKELYDSMHRPPRLGVGAATSGNQTSARETARLKGKLAGSKRGREEEASAGSKQESDDEGESRAKAIKKKARLDPFSGTHGKKRVVDAQTPVKAIAHTQEASASASVVASAKSNSPEVPLSPTKSKKKKHKAKDMLRTSPEVKSTTLSEAVSPRKSSASPFISSKTQEPAVVQPIDNHTKNTSTPQSKDSSESPKAVERLLASSMFSPTPSPRKSMPLDLLKTPLLNLTGPVQFQDSDEDAGTTSPSSPKKKRKRRKKKKHASVTQVAEGSTQ